MCARQPIAGQAPSFRFSIASPWSPSLPFRLFSWICTRMSCTYTLTPLREKSGRSCPTYASNVSIVLGLHGRCNRNLRRGYFVSLKDGLGRQVRFISRMVSYRMARVTERSRSCCKAPLGVAPRAHKASRPRGTDHRVGRANGGRRLRGARRPGTSPQPAYRAGRRHLPRTRRERSADGP